MKRSLKTSKKYRKTNPRKKDRRTPAMCHKIQVDVKRGEAQESGKSEEKTERKNSLKKR